MTYPVEWRSKSHDSVERCRRGNRVAFSREGWHSNRSPEMLFTSLHFASAEVRAKPNHDCVEGDERARIELGAVHMDGSQRLLSWKRRLRSVS